MEAFLEAVAEDFPVEVPVRCRADPASVGVLRLGHAPSLSMTLFAGLWRIAAPLQSKLHPRLKPSVCRLRFSPGSKPGASTQGLKPCF